MLAGDLKPPRFPLHFALIVDMVKLGDQRTIVPPADLLATDEPERRLEVDFPKELNRINDRQSTAPFEVILKSAPTGRATGDHDHAGQVPIGESAEKLATLGRRTLLDDLLQYRSVERPMTDDRRTDIGERKCAALDRPLHPVGPAIHTDDSGSLSSQARRQQPGAATEINHPQTPQRRQGLCDTLARQTTPFDDVLLPVPARLFALDPPPRGEADVGTG